MIWIYTLDLIGTFVFAISGVLAARNKKFDLVGALVIGFVTAIGGGSIRDVMIGRFPVGWLTDINYTLVILAGCVVAFLFGEKVLRLRRSLFIFDTIGIGLFTILGIQTSLSFGLQPHACLLMGVVSACFGGVVRDVLTNIVPLIFRSEIYASACFAGGVVYLALDQILPDTQISMVLSMVIVMIIRYLAIKRGWSLELPDRGGA